MNRKDLFKDMLEHVKTTDIKFIGMGNPLANILIIGKEASIDKLNKEQIEREIDNNISDWVTDIDKQQSEVPYRGIFSPLYPYKGQENKIDPSVKNKKLTYDNGTSPTWFNYQKLKDAIFPSEKKSEIIDFQKTCFITELNENTSRKSDQQDKKLRKESVEKRLKILFSSDYMQSFPVIILACGGYVKTLNIDIENRFNVTNIKKDWVLCGKENNKEQWYVVYQNKPNNLPKIIIHTWQFGGTLTDKYLSKIADEVKDFCAKNNINL